MEDKLYTGQKLRDMDLKIKNNLYSEIDRLTKENKEITRKYIAVLEGRD